MIMSRTLQLDDRLLVLRADASRSIGTGHLMRLLALAQAWIDDGGRALCLVAEAPEALVARLVAEGIEVKRIPASHPDTRDADAVRRVMVDPGAVLAIDSPTIDAAYLETLAAHGDRVLAVDDMAALSRYPVGLVLNQNAHADRSSYPPDPCPQYLLGLRFAMLRREFRNPPPARIVPGQSRHLLITFGGADPLRMTLRTVSSLGRLPATVRDSLEVRVVVGAANPDAGAIEAAAASSMVKTTLEHSVHEMPARMAWADCAVVSGGSTVWELARTGCPALVVETGPSEALLVSGLERVGLFERLGPATELDDETLMTAVARRLVDKEWRSEQARLGPRLVDGDGAGRVVDELARLPHASANRAELRR
jgi:UDP-2,4-diacetamido-2,4,6-trideoxy-beta-L-altropyranose hydrolase